MRATSLPLLLALVASFHAGASGIPQAQRAAAAEQTAKSAASCTPAQPFYWEIGDAQGALAGGQVGDNAPARNTQLHIASASKLIYAAYVAEKRGGNLTAEDINFLTFESGYTRFHVCRQNQAEGACLNSLLNGLGHPDNATAGKFLYNGGHMQKHAALMGMADMNKDAMAAEIHRGLPQLGMDWHFSYIQAQPAGGGAASVADYGQFLRAVIGGQLQIAALLGTHKVCTNPQTCPGEALRTPIPHSETWHYSIGHWVEDDPKSGDGAFSSPGAFGFYPWISADKQVYGIVGRESHHLTLEEQERPAVASVACGQAIRAAWMSGQSRP